MAHERPGSAAVPAEPAGQTRDRRRRRLAVVGQRQAGLWESSSPAQRAWAEGRLPPGSTAVDRLVERVHGGRVHGSRPVGVHHERPDVGSCARMGAVVADDRSSAPQSLQNRAPAAFSRPQFGQVTTAKDYGGTEIRGDPLNDGVRSPGVRAEARSRQRTGRHHASARISRRKEGRGVNAGKAPACSALLVAWLT